MRAGSIVITALLFAACETTSAPSSGARHGGGKLDDPTEVGDGGTGADADATDDGGRDGGGRDGASDGSAHDGSAHDGGAPVSFKNQILPIFQDSCAKLGCHSGLRPKGRLNLEDDVAWPSLVGVDSVQCSVTTTPRKRVVAGNSARSYLVHKLIGEDVCGETDRMPADGPPYLTDDESALIARWIDEGARRN